MANKTQNYNLTQPLETEFYDINVQNENMEKIDRALKGHTDQIFHLQEGQKNKADLDESGKIPSSQLPEFTGVLPVSKGGTGNSDGYVEIRPQLKDMIQPLPVDIPTLKGIAIFPAATILM